MRAIRLRPLPISIAAACAVAAVLLVNPPRGEVRSQAAAFDLGHVPAFGIVALAALAAARRWLPAARRRPAVAAALAVAMAGALGGAVEIIQSFLGRDAEFSDFALDLAGAGICVAFVGFLEAARIRTRVVLGALCAAITAAALTPLGITLAAEARARSMFPALSSFESAWDLRAWVGHLNRFEIVRQGVADDECALVVLLLPGDFPNACLRFFPRDWRGYRALALTIGIERLPPVPLEIRIDDLAHNDTYEDRFNRVLRLQPGRNDIEFPLAEVEAGPRGRKLDLSAVRSVAIFAVHLDEPFRLTIDGVRLIP